MLLLPPSETVFDLWPASRPAAVPALHRGPAHDDAEDQRSPPLGRPALVACGARSTGGLHVSPEVLLAAGTYALALMSILIATMMRNTANMRVTVALEKWAT